MIGTPGTAEERALNAIRKELSDLRERLAVVEDRLSGAAPHEPEVARPASPHAAPPQAAWASRSAAETLDRATDRRTLPPPPTVSVSATSRGYGAAMNPSGRTAADVNPLPAPTQSERERELARMDAGLRAGQVKVRP